MKRILNAIWYGFTLLVIEYILLLIFFQVENIILYNTPVISLRGSIRDATDIIILRLLLYTFFWVVGICLILGYIKIRHVIVKLAAINGLLYVAISFLMTLFFPFAIVYFTYSFFYYQVVAAFLSPFIASRLPYFKSVVSVINRPISS